MRAILAGGLCAVLTVSGVGAVAAQSSDAARAATRQKLWALLDSYPAARQMRWYRNDKDDFGIMGFCDKDLRYTPRFEIYISVTRQQTIAFRVYPQWTGGYMNIDRASDPDGLVRKLLRLSDQSFFFWGADEELDVFAGYTFTLESGFPEDAIKEVILSIPLLDESVGELASLAEQ
jgi:hypothetical protein